MALEAIGSADGKILVDSAEIAEKSMDKGAIGNQKPKDIIGQLLSGKITGKEAVDEISQRAVKDADISSISSGSDNKEFVRKISASQEAKIATDTVGKKVLSNDISKETTQKISEKLNSLKTKGLKNSILKILKYSKNHKFWMGSLAGLALAAVLYKIKPDIFTLKIEDSDSLPFSLITWSLSRSLKNLSKNEKSFDWDKNGTLDEDETLALSLYEKSLKRQREEKEKTDLLEKFDVNKDGKIDDVERAALDVYFKKEKEAEAELKTKFDFDKDGKIDAREQAALSAYRDAIKGRGE